jgi:hypothetical protein
MSDAGTNDRGLTGTADGTKGQSPVSLEFLTKVLAVTIVFYFNKQLGLGATILGAVLASLLPDGVGWFVKRRRWGKRRVGLLALLIALFDQFDQRIARALRRWVPPAVRRLFARVGGQVGHAIATSIAALVVVTVVVVVAPGQTPSKNGYAAAVLADHPAVYYRLGELTGPTAADTSGHGVKGTYAGSGITYGVPGAILSDAHTAISSTGRAPAMIASDSSLPSGRAPRTLEIWERTRSLVNQPYEYLILYGTYATGEDVDIALLGSTSFAFSINSGAFVTFTSSQSLTDGNWHQLVGAYDGDVTATGYVDGQRVGSGTLAQQANTVPGGIGLQIGGSRGARERQEASLWATSTRLPSIHRPSQPAACGSTT